MWMQLYVRAPEGNGYQTPEAMKRVDEHLVSKFAAMFCAPQGVPIQEPDGTFEVRVLMLAQVGLVKTLLTGHYGLVVVREVRND